MPKFKGVLMGTQSKPDLTQEYLTIFNSLCLHASLDRELTTLKISPYASDNSNWHQPTHSLNKQKGGSKSSKV